MASATLTQSAAWEGMPVRWAWSLAAIVAAHVPVLGILYAEMWSDPDYNFFPLAWLGAGLLAWRETRFLGTLEPGRWGRSCCLLGVVWVGLIASALVVSPWLACVVAHVTVIALAYLWGGGRLVQALLPAWMFLWVAIPRYGLDEFVRGGLLQLASRSSSAVLDLTGVLHVPQGNVIALAGRRLLVEEACSGVHSLFVTVAAVLFFVLWVRVSVFRALVLLAATVFWVVVVNTVRIVLVTWSVAKWDLDLLSGWRHELVGLGLVGLTLGLLASTDRFYRVVSGGMADFWSELAEPWRQWRMRQQEERKFWKLMNNLMASPSPESDEAPPPVVPAAIGPPPPPEPTRWPALGETVLAWRGFTVSYSILAVAMPIVFWPSIRVALGAQAPEGELVVRLHRLGADVMPRSLGPFHQLEFRTVRRDVGSEFGQFSRIWRYGFGHHQANACVDYLFAGWHELSSCYARGGWNLVRRSGEPPAIVAAELRNGTGEYGTVFFSIIDARGVPRSPSRVQRWLDRFAVWQEPSLSSLWERIRKRGKFYQVQLLVTSGRPLSPEERKQARDLFLNVRQRAMEGVGHVRSGTP